MRALIEARLSCPRTPVDPRARILRHVEGAVSSAFLDLLNNPRREAAVLMPLIERPAGLSVLFTERAMHLRDHPGQVSFPGGRIQPDDANAVAAALREAGEEIGLAADLVSVAGCLDVHLTGTGLLVTPVVGFVDAPFEPRLDPNEVSGVFEVPLSDLMSRPVTCSAYRERLGTTFRVYEIEYGPHLIWGATAAMLMNFRELILNEKT